MKTLIALVLTIPLVAACGADEPGESAFKDANRILGVHNQQTAFGNGPAAEQLAERFNSRLKVMRQIGFTEKKGPSISPTDSEFMTYCQLTDDAILFLVNVPDLRNFKEDAQGTLLDLAWLIARGLRADVRPARDLRLGVGLRGTLLYGAAAFGAASAAQPEKKTNSGVIANEDFFSFFLGAYPQDTELAGEHDAAATAAPSTPTPTPTPGTTDEVAEPGDRVARHIALLETDPPSTAVAVAADLLAASEPLGRPPLTVRLMHGPAIAVAPVGHLYKSDLVLLRPLQPFKFEPIEFAKPGALQSGTSVTTYFATLRGDVIDVRKYASLVTSLIQDPASPGTIHTDERREIIAQGGALVDAQGRLLGIGTAGATVYGAAADVQRLINTVHEGDRMKLPQ